MGDSAQQAETFARAIARQFVQFGGSGGARVGVVTFARDATVLTPLTGSMGAVDAALDAYATGGGTSISDGLAEALAQLDGASGRPGALRVVVLLSDGKQTVDGDDATAIAQAHVLKTAGAVDLFAVGFGSADAATIEAIASEPPSQFAFIGANLAAVSFVFLTVVRLVVVRPVFVFFLVVVFVFVCFFVLAAILIRLGLFVV